MFDSSLNEPNRSIVELGQFTIELHNYLHYYWVCVSLYQPNPTQR